MGLRQGLVNDLLEVLRASGYLDNRPDAMVRSTLHQLATKLDSLEEARVLRGMLKPVRWKLGVLPKRG
jgi:tRNA C32,U32 (ribose-2'-O)-methylase TrmJ